MEFITGCVPVSEAAKIFKKDPNWIRQGIICGWLPIGVATRNGRLVTNLEYEFGRINFYISPKKLYDYTGYVWRGEKQNEHDD